MIEGGERIDKKRNYDNNVNQNISRRKRKIAKTCKKG